MFYNEDLKMRYINEKEREVVLPNCYLVSQFTKIFEMETELDKDASNFTTYEIIEYYKIRNFSSLDSLKVLNSQLSMYTQWCLQENLVKDNQNHYLEITMEIMQTCVNKAVLDMKIVSRETLLQWVDELPNPKDQFILLALFEYGKSKNFADIVNVKMSDFSGNTLTLNDGREVHVSDKLKEVAEESYNERIYYSMSGKGVKKMPLVADGDKVIKEYPNVKADVSEFQLSRRMYNSITRSLDYVGALSWCSANSLAESGKIHMIKEKAKQLGITPMQYLYSDNISQVSNQFGYNIVRSIFGVKYKEYLN